MFDSDDKNQTGNQQTDSSATSAVPVAAPPEDSLVTAPPDPVVTPTAPPINDAASAHSEPMTSIEPATGNDPSQDINSAADPTPPSQAPLQTATANADDLISIKQQALQSLAPLVNQLEQSPEEKFKTTMMLIQASDNAGLIKDAYEAANSIADEKARAQALLDVVNEINYFTQHQNPQEG